MKRKLLATLLISAMVFSGCGSTSSPPSATPETPAVESSAPESAEEGSEYAVLDALGDVDVEKELFDVTITVPADFIGEATQADLDEGAKENGYKVKLNDDGSATFTMTKSQHREMLSGIAENLSQELSDMVGSEDFPTFTDISYNDDFTSFTVTTTSSELNLTESMSVLVFYSYGGMYNIFTGNSVDNIHVDFVNADTGDIISSSDSKDTE